MNSPNYFTNVPWAKTKNQKARAWFATSTMHCAQNMVNTQNVPVEQMSHSVRHGLEPRVLDAPLSVRRLTVSENFTSFYSLVERSFV